MVTKRVLGVALLIAVFSISPLTAQINRFSSNTSSATSGLFAADTDDFLDVNSWQNVEFGTFFTTLLVDGMNGGVGAGLAVRMGTAYLGFGYFGTFWDGAFGSTTTEAGGNETVARTGDLRWTNQISVLFGTEMLGGFLLDFNLAGMGRNNRDTEVVVGGDILTNENTVGFGALEVGLRWGRNFELANGLTLKPTLGFSYNLNTERTEARPIGQPRTTTLNGIDPFFSRPDLAFADLNGGRVGLTGGINVHAGLGVDRVFGDVDGSLWVGYDLEIRTYDRQTRASGTWTDFAPSFNQHLINVGVGAWYTLDRRLSFAWSVECDINIISAEVTSAQHTGANPVHQLAISEVEISPQFAAGVVFQAIPGRFNLNASIALSPLQFTRTQMEHHYLGVGAETTNITTTNISRAQTYTLLGFTWFLGDNLSLDAALNPAPGARIDATTFAMLLSYKR